MSTITVTAVDNYIASWVIYSSDTSRSNKCHKLLLDGEIQDISHSRNKIHLEINRL